MVVLKYGGTSVTCCPETIVKRARSSTKAVLVVSALAGVTNLLMGDEEDHRGTLYKIHQEWIQQAKLPDDVSRRLMAMIRTLPWHFSTGEKASCILVTALLNYTGIGATALFSDEKRIIVSTDQKVQRVNVAPITRCHEEGTLPVVTGFISHDETSGTTDCLGRSGSDVTAAAIGEAMMVPTYIFTDVDGIMSADPRICSEARTIRTLTRDEAFEMAFSGASVLHPDTLAHNTDLFVQNTFDEMAPITRILRTNEKNTTATQPIKSVLLVDDCIMLDIFNPINDVGVPGRMADIFSRLRHINIRFVTQTCAETLISVVIDEMNQHAAVTALSGDYTTVPRPVAIVTVIGDGLRNRVGMASIIFRRIANDGINVEGISQGSSERSMSIVVARCDARSVVAGLHSVVVSGWTLT